MDGFDDEIEAVRSWTERSISDFIQYLPNLIFALLALLLGWVLARLLRGLVKRLSRWGNRRLDGLFKRGSADSARTSESAAAILAEVVFWIVIFVAIAVSARIAGLALVSTWLDQIVKELPNVFVGAAIIIVGYVIGAVVGDQVSAAAQAARSRQNVVLGRLAQSAVFISALIIGLGQIGIDVTFLVALFAVATGAIFVGFSLAFGLGAKDFISDLVSARDITRDLKPGLSVRIGGVEGVVLEVSSTRIALDTAEGRALIPARQVSSDAIVIVAVEGDPGGDQ